MIDTLSLMVFTESQRGPPPQTLLLSSPPRRVLLSPPVDNISLRDPLQSIQESKP